MVLPAQFQLGLGLTNIVNPISQAVSAVGSLALMDAIRRSGSDIITEMRLCRCRANGHPHGKAHEPSHLKLKTVILLHDACHYDLQPGI